MTTQPDHLAQRILDHIDTELAVCDAATAGPWNVSSTIYEEYGAPHKCVWDGATYTPLAHVFAVEIPGAPDRVEMASNADFISHARTGYPATLRALREQVEWLRDTWNNAYGFGDLGLCGICEARLCAIARQLGLDMGSDWNTRMDQLGAERGTYEDMERLTEEEG